MSSPDTVARMRLADAAASRRSTHVAGALTIAAIIVAAGVGVWYSPVLFFAVGAGAGYSLSGSV